MDEAVTDETPPSINRLSDEETLGILQVTLRLVRRFGDRNGPSSTERWLQHSMGRGLEMPAGGKHTVPPIYCRAQTVDFQLTYSEASFISGVSVLP